MRCGASWKTTENGFRLTEFPDVPIEYLVKGELVNTDFHDAKLLELFGILDSMSGDERSVAKRYLDKLIRNRQEWQEIKRQAES